MSLASVLLTSDVPLRIGSIPKHTTPWPIRRGHVVPDNFPVPECLVRVLLGDCTAANIIRLQECRCLSTLSAKISFMQHL